jgi:inhibitor of KinA
MAERHWPQVRTMGLSGLLVRFGDRLDAQSNQAAIACRAGLEAEAWPEVDETASALASVFLRVDLARYDEDALIARLDAWLGANDWTRAGLPDGRKLWHIPAVFGGDHGPQLGEVAGMAGVSEADVIEAIATERTRVLTLGFAPGQPYLGILPELWDLPRQTGVTARVPAGALVIAVRQMVLFANPSPTGWRQIAQTAFKCFDGDAPDPMPLSPGDEVRFVPVDALGAPAWADVI